MTWTAIAVTRRHGSRDIFVEQELKVLRTQGVLPTDVPLLVVEDACPDVGSGGSTLNALLVVVEHLCAQRGFTVLNEHVLKDAKILVVHLGRPFMFDPRGAAFMDLNADFISSSGHQAALTPFINQFRTITALAANGRAGVWISGCDCYWQLEPSDCVIEWPKCDLTAFALPVTRDFANNHGIYILDSQNKLTDIQYQAPVVNEANEKVPLVLALMHMSVKAATQLLGLHVQYPLSASTYLGIDSGGVGLKLSLFFDFLLPTCTNITEADFCSGTRAGLKGVPLSKCETRPERMADLAKARKLLWNCFSKLQSKAVFLNASCYHYFTNKPDDMVQFVNGCLNGNVKSFTDVCKLFRSPTFENIRADQTDIRVRLLIPHSQDGLTVFAKNVPNCRDLNSSKVKDFQTSDGDALAIDEVFLTMKSAYYFKSAREFKVNFWLAEMSRVLKTNSHKCLLPIFRTICSFDDPFFTNLLFKLLDDIAIDSKSTRIAGRAMSCVADVLGILAGNQGGLRSGPAANTRFTAALSLLQTENTTEEGIRRLRQVCNKWMDTPSRLIRAARHYEAAAQIFTRRTVMHCKQYMCLEIAAGVSVRSCKALAAARIDVAGGWSDTPPITFEYGGAVVDIAIKVDGKKPVSCTCKKLSNQAGVFVWWWTGEERERIAFLSKDAIIDAHDKPSAQGGLICAALVASGLFDHDEGKQSLGALIQAKFDDDTVGLEIETESLLPHGSGMGASSILAGCVLVSVWNVMGLKYDESSLLHGILYVEQLLTTGGGWQDQVGGLTAGLKIGRFGNSPDTARISVEHFDVSNEQVAVLSDRLALVYTGRTRLAKNLLQEVVRSWYARQSHVVTTIAELVANAETCATAIKRCDWQAMALCAKKYWEQKKLMAPGCEPEEVENLIANLYERSVAEAAWLAGAGGGGFLYVLLKEGKTINDLTTTIAGVNGCESMTVHSVQIDMDPLIIELS